MGRKAVDIGHTGLDGCLHTFREHAGTKGSFKKKMKDTDVTNAIKIAHGWQNDGYQQALFHENNEETECPAGCGQREGRMHCVQCQAESTKTGYKKRKIEFQKIHKTLKTT